MLKCFHALGDGCAIDCPSAIFVTIANLCVAEDSAVRLDQYQKPEFDDWRWVSYWYPLTQIVPFKREVYRRAMKELSPRFGRLSHLGK
jgi:8-oxo-dGTP pyrophosphatase MutT (NUDIX family)